MKDEEGKRREGGKEGRREGGKEREIDGYEREKKKKR